VDFIKNFVDFENLLEVELRWRQIFDHPGVTWCHTKFRLDRFSRSLDANRQTSKV